MEEETQHPTLAVEGDRTVDLSDNGGKPSSYTFIDADTLRGINGGRYRIQGIQAAETWKETPYGVKLSDPGAAELTGQTAALANYYGFNKLQRAGEQGQYGRELVDLVDDGGRSFSSFLVQSGITGGYASADNDENYSYAAINRMVNETKAYENLSTAELARLSVVDAIRSEGNLGLKVRASNEKELGAYDYLRGDSNQARLELELKDLNKQIASSTDPDERRTLLARREELNQEKSMAHQLPDAFLGVDHRRYDRSLGNESYNQLSDSWSMGWQNVGSVAYGALQAIGDFTDITALEEFGEQGVARKNEILSDYGSVLVDWNEVDDVGDFFKWTANNVAMGVPFYAATAAAVAAGVAVTAVGGPAGAGLAVSAIGTSLLGVGEVYNSMEGEKSPGYALAGGFFIGLLDRLPFGGSFTKKSVSKTIGKAQKEGWSSKKLSEELFEEAAEAYSKTRGVPLDEARRQIGLKGAIYQKEFLADMGKFSAKRLHNSQLVKKALSRVAQSAGTEAATEFAQTMLEHGFAAAGSESVFNIDEALKEGLTAAFVGGILGGSTTVGSTAHDFNLASILRGDSKPFTPTFDRDKREAAAAKKIQDSPAFRGATTEDWLRYKDEETGLDQFRSPEDVLKSIERARENRKKPSFVEKAKEFISTPEQALNARAMTAIDGIRENQDGSINEEAYILGQLIRGVRNAVVKGGDMVDIYTASQNLYGSVASLIPETADIGIALGVRGNRNIHSALHDKIQEYTDENGQIVVPDSDPEVQTIVNSFHKAVNKLQQIATDNGLTEEAELLSDPNFFLQASWVRPNEVLRDPDGFRQALIGTTRRDGDSAMSSAEADEIIELIEDGSIVRASDLLKNYLVNEDAREYFNTDISANISKAAQAVTDRATFDNLFGRDNTRMAGIVQSMVKPNGITQEQADEFNLQMHELRLEKDGKYGAWDSKGAQWIQENLLEWTMLNSLPLAALSSAPEVPLINLGVPGELWFKDLADMALPLAKEAVGYVEKASGGYLKAPKKLKKLAQSERMTVEDIIDTINSATSDEVLASDLGPEVDAVVRRKEDIDRSFGNIAAPLSTKEAGYIQESSDVLARMEAQQTSAKKRRRAQWFTQVIGLQFITNFTRGGRLVKAGQMLEHHLSILDDVKYNGAGDNAFLEPDSPIAKEHRKELERMGVDVDGLLEVRRRLDRAYAFSSVAALEGGTLKKSEKIKAKDIKKYRQELGNFSIRFVDEAIVNPFPGSTPSLYKYQKLALFNQFQGFIANFQAQVLPKIASYLTQQGKAYTMSTLTTATSMLAASFLAFAMRDLIKYGESALEKEYLNEYEYWRRAVGGTGLLGVAERLYNLIDPLYEDQYGSTLEKVAGAAFGEAASSRTLTNFLGGSVDLAEGLATGNDELEERGIRQVLKTAPIIGNINRLRDHSTNIISDLL